MSKNRYEDVPESVYEVLTKVRRNHFTELKNAAIKVLFDTKKRITAGQMTLACIVKPNDLIKHFTAEEAQDAEGYDYIVIVDKTCWENCLGADRERLMRHELRHAWFDIEAEHNPYKLLGHDVNDFYAEIDLNAADPRWSQRLANLTLDIYSQRKDDSGNKKHKRKGGLDNVTYLPPGQKTPIEEEAERGQAPA
jgi:cation transport regulator ChaB